MRDQIRRAICDALRPLDVTGKIGESKLKGAVADSLRSAGFRADLEDQAQFLRSGMPVWRSKDTGLVEETRARRRIDIVVYRGDDLVGLIETESDLDDLREEGISSRSGHYDVFSIARSGSGEHFDSYKSIERMAAAAFYWNSERRAGAYPSPKFAELILTAVKSDRPLAHNPAGVPLFLVSGRCRPKDPPIILARLRSLDAELLCAKGPAKYSPD